MIGLEYLFLFLLGISFGSFFNVVAYRFNLDEHIFKHVGGRSHCMTCNRQLRWYELIPILSFIIQLGKCKGCKDKISLQYPIVETITGLLFVLTAFILTPIGTSVLSNLTNLIVWLLVVSVLILISIIDFRTRIIPDELNIAILLLAIINSFLVYKTGVLGAIGDGLYNSLFSTHVALNGTFLGTVGMNIWITNSVLLNILYGGLFGAIFFGGIYFLSRGRAMGFGDVKMAFVSGFLLGFPDMIVATMLAFITGAFFGVFLIVIKKKEGIKDTMPFGPFIALGIIITVFFGYDIISAYFNFFNLIL